MESVIKWQTGVPKENGMYLVTTVDNRVTICFFTAYNEWYLEDVIAWCPLSEIEPYKE